ncbi:unnamed protein product [Natator depressus]
MRHFRFLQDVSARRWGSGLRHFRYKERQSDTAQPTLVRFRPPQPRYGRVLGLAQPPSIHPPRSTPAPRRAQPCSPAHPSSSERRAQNSWGPRFSVPHAQKHAKETCGGTRAAFTAAQAAPFPAGLPWEQPRRRGRGGCRACLRDHRGRLGERGCQRESDPVPLSSDCSFLAWKVPWAPQH